MVGSGPGLITGGTNLAFTSTGLVSIVASQDGNAFFDPAVNVTNTYDVLPSSQLGQVITNFIPTNGASFAQTNLVGLSAQASSLLPVSFVVGSGPGLITGGTNLAFTCTGLVSIVASQAGSEFYSAAPDVTNTFVVTGSSRPINDFDGDGRTDLAVYWPDGGNWYINYSGGGTYTQNWGWNEAVP
ncbi:MAG: hypothetical protein WCL44_10060, partial [bacterium]